MVWRNKQKVTDVSSEHGQKDGGVTFHVFHHVVKRSVSK